MLEFLQRPELQFVLCLACRQHPRHLGLSRSAGRVARVQEGNRVKAVVQFRGREIAHTDLGKKLLTRFAEDLAAYGSVEGVPRLEGRNAHILISPTKATKTV